MFYTPSDTQGEKPKCRRKAEQTGFSVQATLRRGLQDGTKKMVAALKQWVRSLNVRMEAMLRSELIIKGLTNSLKPPCE